ncbi:MAG: hypothetical protein JO327_08515 [Nitrososphaeraceae archaeon]|nr:hypothetical protein [Nitrososphaeraceae archaeon]
MRKNHKTTTLLVAMAVIAATLLAAGTVAAVGSNHSAFAHKEYKSKNDKYTKQDKSGRDGNNINVNKQTVKCIVVGSDSGMKWPDGKTPLSPDATGDAIGPDACHAFNENTNYDGGQPSYTGPSGSGPPGRGPM